MKIAVFGANGMLGRYMCKWLSQTHEIVEITRKDLDLSNFNDYDKIGELINKCDVVLNCAGTIKPVANEQDKRDTFMVNAVFPNYLSRFCYINEIPMIHFTTDCVFSGEIGHYNEEHFHDMFDDYGLSKSMGESAYSHNIRTSIIGEEVGNKRSLLEWAKSQRGQKVKGFLWHFWNGLTCLELAKFVEYYLDNGFHKDQPSTFHLYSNSVSKFELLGMISSAFGLDLNIEPTQTATCNRTLTSKVGDFAYLVPDLDAQIKELAEFHNTLFSE